jgi:hypothetical protein
LKSLVFSVHASSWTTKQPGGFSDEQLNALRSLMHRARRQSGGAAGKIAGRLHRTIVVSAEFAGHWADLGEFPIAGFSKAERVYGLQGEMRTIPPARS